jgi:hypothetical protein
MEGLSLKARLGAVTLMAVAIGLGGATAAAGSTLRTAAQRPNTRVISQGYCLDGAISFSAPLLPAPGVAAKDALAWQMIGNCGYNTDSSEASLGGVLTASSQSCSGGAAKGTVWLDWAAGPDTTGGSSTAHLRLSLSLTQGEEIPVTISGSITSGLYAGDTLTGDGDIALQTVTGSACGTAASNGGQPVVGGSLHVSKLFLETTSAV